MEPPSNSVQGGIHLDLPLLDGHELRFEATKRLMSTTEARDLERVFADYQRHFTEDDLAESCRSDSGAPSIGPYEAVTGDKKHHGYGNVSDEETWAKARHETVAREDL